MFALEVGIEQSIDLGVEGEEYFGPLRQIATDVVRLFTELPQDRRRGAHRRLKRLIANSSHIGWGFGDELRFMVDSLSLSKAAK
jgi:hypothetical protein